MFKKSTILPDISVCYAYYSNALNSNMQQIINCE